MNQPWLDTLQIVQIIGTLLLIGVGLPVYTYWRMRRQLRSASERAERAEAKLERVLTALDATQRQALASYATSARPLESPPAGIMPTLRAVHQEYNDPYTVALGWEVVGDEPAIVAVSLYGDSPIKAGHMLLTGETDWGKDGLAFLIAATLCARTKPHQLQIFWIDGKGPDGALWRGRAHNWREPVTGEDGLAEAIAALEVERGRRTQLLQAKGVTKWEELAEADRPPLLWVYVSELKLLRKQLGSELEQWLERELSSARAGGIRYCIGLQNATNLKMEWRSQIGCFVAGGQSSRDADKPNLNLSTEEIRERGAIPPSALPAPGYFTVRVRRDVATVRAPLISLAERKDLLRRLPAAPSILPVFPTPSTAQESLGSLFPVAEEVPADSAILTPVGPEEHLPEGWGEGQYAQARALLAEGKTDGQIVAAVFKVTGGRRYGPLVSQVAQVRATTETTVSV